MVDDALQRLINNLKEKLINDLSEIGAELYEFDPENKVIEVAIEPNTPEMQKLVLDLIQDALDLYCKRKDAVLYNNNPFSSVEDFID